MADLTCLTIFEAGAFGSDSGNVLRPTIAIPFPITMTGGGAGRGATYGYASTGGVTRFAARGAGASWGFAAPEIPSNADQDDLFVILY